MKIEENEAIKLLQFIWDHNKTHSWVKLNSMLHDALHIAIKGKMTFGIDDFNLIYKKFNGVYWFGANANGKGIGEVFYYYSVVNDNKEAIKSYEKWTGLKAFIITNKRLYTGCIIVDGVCRYRVTGFNDDYSRIMIVAYDVADWNESGKKKLLSFNNIEWLEFRKDKEIR
jgi:hypothetical protein